jgi:hypothetical protein
MHQLVLGQIDGAHTAAADQPQHAILTEEEAAVLLVHQLIDVPLREQALVDQEGGQAIGVGQLAGVRGLAFVESFLQRLRLDELASLDVIDEALN